MTGKQPVIETPRRLGSSQSRVAKLEAGDRSVSIDLLMRALLSLGANRKQIAAMIGTAQRRGEKLERHGSLVLCAGDRRAFFDALVRSAAPNARPKRAVRTERKRVER